jgi:anti-sigma regulatory factor (Ser/Thr protein kinase)
VQNNRAWSASEGMHETEDRGATADARDPVAAVSGRLPAQPESVSAVRHRVRDFAREQGLPAELVDRVALAVTEAAANAVLHAYGPDEVGDVHFAAALDQEELEVVVFDDGGGLRDDNESPGIGWGLRLIERTSTEFRLHPRHPRGTEVRMRFAVRSGPSHVFGAG